MELNKESTKNLQRTTAAYHVRPYSKEDKAAWLAVNSDKSDKDFIKLLQTARDLQKADKAYYLAIVQKSNQQLIGTLMLTALIREQYQSAFLGLAINQKQVGDQVILESFAAAMDIAFNDLDLHRIEVLYVASVMISKQTLKTLGLRSEGFRKQCFLQDQKWLDAEVFAIVKEEWQQKQVSSLMNTTYNMK